MFVWLDNSSDSSFFLLTPLDDTPYRRMCMSYQVEEIVVPALAHVVGSGITVDCGIMYVPNGWWKKVVQTLKMQFFVQLQLYLVAKSTTRAVSTT
jgi:hypothetical protein